MSVVYVTNRSGTDHADSYGGVRYEFDCGKPVEVPAHVATELFGYGQHNKEQYVVRLGWTKDSTDMPQALQRLEKFHISEELPKDRYLASAVGSVTSFPDAGRGRKAAFKAA